MHLQDNCQSGTDGTLLWFDYNREIDLASCDVIKSCVQEILQNDFSEFTALGGKSLQNLLDSFRNEYNSFVSSLPVEEPANVECYSMLDEYSNLYTDLYTLQDQASGRQPISPESLETFLNAPRTFTKVSEVKNACFWFEDYFWWRGKKQFVCSLGSAASKDRAKNDMPGSHWPSGPRDWFQGSPTTPLYGFDESPYSPYISLKETSFRLKMYCMFDILTGGRQSEGIPPFWESIQCIIAQPTTPIIVAPPPSPTGLPGPTGPHTPAPTMAPDPTDHSGDGVWNPGKLHSKKLFLY